ncbi:hypothetical protein FAI40_04550 [Acetobacteraceae bacterium]|nr:hypothetical protein FAI40_04550 [Acetobacteraceae bacterium]
MLKSTEYLVEEGADKGKLFVITRMSAFAADEWARDIVRGLAAAGNKLLTSSIDLGVGSLANVSFALFGAMHKEDVDRALLLLRECCQIRRDARNPLVEPTKILEVDIEDPQTIKNLYVKAFELHVDFLKAAAELISPIVAAMAAEDNKGKESPAAT